MIGGGFGGHVLALLGPDARIPMTRRGHAIPRSALLTLLSECVGSGVGAAMDLPARLESE